MRSLFLSLCLALPILGALSAAACSSDDSTAPTSGGACTKSSDCGSGQACGYSLADKCAAVGQCIAANNSYPFDGYGCDGTAVGFVSPGYGAAPVTSENPCATDAGPTDSGPSTEDGGGDASTDAALDGAAPSEAGTDGGNDASVDGSTDAPVSTDASDASHD